MIREIVRDEMFLKRKSEPAGRDDLQIACDLQDTLRAHRQECAGMAANMIGFSKRIIIAAIGPIDLIMINPVITKRSGRYETEEGCLSLSGLRHTVRYQQITVSYKDMAWEQHVQEFSGWTAQVIQHECDHLEGILI